MSDNDSKTVMQNERRRLGQVRKAFEAGIAQLTSGAAVSVEFSAVCVDYIKASMDRLHVQDQRIHDILKPHIAASDTEGLATIENLQMRLMRSREALSKLVSARDAYRAKLEIADFKATVDMFMDVYMNVLLKGQHSTLAMQDKHFGPTTWDTVAGVSQDSRITEATLFAGVKRLAPSGADPEGFKGTRPGA